MTQELVLRGFQEEGVVGLRAAIRRGRRRLLLVSPTGSGKSVIIGYLARGSSSKGLRVLILAHREELIAQLSQKLDRFSVDHGVLQGNHPRVKPWCTVQVASVPTLARRLDRLPPADIIFVDEAHHSAAASFRSLLAAYPNAIVIGFTATPERLDGTGLEDCGYEEMVILTSIPELIVQGLLVPPTVFEFNGPSAKGVHKTGGDYNKNELGALMGAPQVIGNVVHHWLRWAKGETTVLFAPNVETSKSVVARFMSEGIRAVHVDADTPKALRRDSLARIESGEITIVSNVGLLTEGWDLPRVTCVQLMRHTLSVSLHFQMIGRGLRPWCTVCDGTDLTCESRSHKRRCLVLDHVRNNHWLGRVTWPRTYSLKGEVRTKDGQPGRRSGVPATWRCKSCPVMNLATDEVCVYCGALRPESSKVVKEKPGELLETKDDGWKARIPPASRAKTLAKFMFDCLQHKHWKPSRAIVIYSKMFGGPPDPQTRAEAEAIVRSKLEAAA